MNTRPSRHNLRARPHWIGYVDVSGPVEYRQVDRVWIESYLEVPSGEFDQLNERGHLVGGLFLDDQDDPPRGRPPADRIEIERELRVGIRKAWKRLKRPPSQKDVREELMIGRRTLQARITKSGRTWPELRSAVGSELSAH